MDFSSSPSCDGIFTQSYAIYCSSGSVPNIEGGGRGIQASLCELLFCFWFCMCVKRHKLILKTPFCEPKTHCSEGKEEELIEKTDENQWAMRKAENCSRKFSSANGGDIFRRSAKMNGSPVWSL